MSVRGTVGSLIESHRAKAKRPDRRNFLPQFDFLVGRASSRAGSSVASPHPIFSGRLPQLRSIVLKASLSVPNGPPPVPIFLASLPCERPRPHWRHGRPQRTGGQSQFFCGFPHCTEGFPQFPGHVPQFFSRRPRFQWSVPQPFMRISSSQPSKSQLKTDYEP